MEPFTPDDPLWKLMGKSRPVAPRPHFTQNVLRAVRQEPQALSWWARVGEWLAFRRSVLIGGIAAAAVVAAMGVMLLQQNEGRQAPGTMVADAAGQVSDAEMASIAAEDVSVPLASLDHMDALVAMEDTSKLTDSDLQFLLY